MTTQENSNMSKKNQKHPTPRKLLVNRWSCLLFFFLPHLSLLFFWVQKHSFLVKEIFHMLQIEVFL